MGRQFEFYLQLEALLQEMFPDTATEDFIERWGIYFDVRRNAATRARGNIIIGGTPGSSIPIATQFQSLNGNSYTADASIIISANTIGIVSVTRSGTIVTVITSSNHNLAPNISVTIAGAIETEYNGVFIVTTTADATTFTYEISTAPSTPATGTISVSYNTAKIAVTSEDFGQDVNADVGTALTLTTPISGVNSTGYVRFDTIGGGTDIENDEDYRNRVLERIRNRNALFNVAQIIAQAKLVSGVTRVFVREAGTTLDGISLSSIIRNGNVALATTISPHNLESGMQVTITGANETEFNVIGEIIIRISDTEFAYPVIGSPSTPATGSLSYTPAISPGQVFIYPLRDNDTSIIPDASEINAIKNKIAEIKPAHMSLVDLKVLSPTGVSVDFVFTALEPNTPEVKSAIEANLSAIFEEQTAEGKNLLEDEYRSVIFQSVDPATGIAVSSFTLSAPVGDITINSGEIPILGNITYP